MTARLNRRQILETIAGLGLGLPALSAGVPFAAAGERRALGEPVAFSFDNLKAKAKELASKPWQRAEPANRQILEQIDWDSHELIRFKPEASLQLGKSGHTAIRLFHPGKWFMEPVTIHLVDGGTAREVLFSPDLFDMPADHPARRLSEKTGFAGFRVMGEDGKSDWLAYLGATYYRSAAPFNQYGLSARGLALNTALSTTSEEFPRFTSFWLEGAADGPELALTIYALLDSASVAGAYRFNVVQRKADGAKRPVVMEVECELHARTDIGRVGIAPFSSMFWYGKGKHKAVADWRPELHDSDGLAIETGTGERIWRPLNDPTGVVTSTFVDRDTKGFGLLQRDRRFEDYLDDKLFYEKRPSVWVEPLDPWGEGAVQLIEFHTDDEISDNVVAYWTPKDGFKAGQSYRYRYRLSWVEDIPFPATLARAIASWQGIGGDPTSWDKRPVGVQRFVIDWEGEGLAGMTRYDGIEPVVTISRGNIIKAYTHEIVGQHARWRTVFDIQADGAERVDLRAYLKRGNSAMTETWIGQYFPAE